MFFLKTTEESIKADTRRITADLRSLRNISADLNDVTTDIKTCRDRSGCRAEYKNMWAVLSRMLHHRFAIKTSGIKAGIKTGFMVLLNNLFFEKGRRKWGKNADTVRKCVSFVLARRVGRCRFCIASGTPVRPRNEAKDKKSWQMMWKIKQGLCRRREREDNGRHRQGKGILRGKEIYFNDRDWKQAKEAYEKEKERLSKEPNAWGFYRPGSARNCYR